MKLLVIGSDRNLFKEGSDVWNRYLDYGKLFQEIHVIVFSGKKLKNQKTKIGENIFVYPTNHFCKLFYLWGIYKISKSIILNKDIVISSQDPFEAGLAGWMLKKIYNLSLQIQIHTDFLSPYFWQESFLNKFRVSLAKFIIPRADKIRVVSERIKHSLISNFKPSILNRIIVLPIFVDVEVIKTAPIKTDLHKKYPQFNFIILMSSRITKEKNIGLAIEAMSELVKKHPKLGLIIVGSGSEEARLKYLVLRLKINNSVVFEGWSDDLVSYYKTADLFLLTSNYEGYGRTVIEAMAAGLPVVTTDVGLAGEVLKNKENGIVVPVGDESAMIREVDFLMSNTEELVYFSKNSIKVSENLMTKERYLKLYKQII